MRDDDMASLLVLLDRIAAALERLAINAENRSNYDDEEYP